MNEPQSNHRTSMISWQVIAWILGVILSSATTYQYATAQAQLQLGSVQVRLSVIESRYDEIERRLARIETLVQQIANKDMRDGR